MRVSLALKLSYLRFLPRPLRYHTEGSATRLSRLAAAPHSWPKLEKRRVSHDLAHRIAAVQAACGS